MGTLIALSAGAYQYMGFTLSQDHYGSCIKVVNVPVFNIDGKMLLGVYNNQALLQYFTMNEPKISDVKYKTILSTFHFLNDMEKFKRSEMLMITISGDIFIWDQGDLVQVDGDYMAIGRGKDLALGCLFGTSLKDLTSEERMQQALYVLEEYHPDISQSVGILKI